MTSWFIGFCQLENGSLSNKNAINVLQLGCSCSHLRISFQEHAVLGAFDIHSTCYQKIIEIKIANPKRHALIRKILGNGAKLVSASVAQCLVGQALGGEHIADGFDVIVGTLAGQVRKHNHLAYYHDQPKTSATPRVTSQPRFLPFSPLAIQTSPWPVVRSPISKL